MIVVQDETSLWMFPGGCDPSAADQAHLVDGMDIGDVIVWKGTHAGAGYAIEHYRWHAYIDPPDHIYRRPRPIVTDVCRHPMLPEKSLVAAALALRHGNKRPATDQRLAQQRQRRGAPSAAATAASTTAAATSSQPHSSSSTATLREAVNLSLRRGRKRPAPSALFASDELYNLYGSNWMKSCHVAALCVCRLLALLSYEA